jgi:hypothetical protein
MVGKLAVQDEPAALVSIRRIKMWAATNLGTNSALRGVLEREEETVRAGEFVVKMGVWLQLLEVETAEQRNGRH